MGEDRSERRVVVEVKSAITCERCESGKGCGAGLLGKQGGDKYVEATLAAGIVVGDGDHVSLMLEPRNILRAAIIVYGYPLAGAVLAATVAFAIGWGDIAGAFAALTGIVIGILVARIRLRNRRYLRNFMPVVVDRLSAARD
jgi:sigma-E factor negative regulatory protein RseC